jgi:UDP-2-acetamido-2,6-beta-L-arabino-hexul-4-ose reductase
MITALVTGSEGFIGRNLIEGLEKVPGLRIVKFDVGDQREVLHAGLKTADVVFHLAGVNRPEKEEEFATGNAGLTEAIVSELLSAERRPLLVLSSSIQAEQQNPYGKSKQLAESSVERYGKAGGGSVIFRLPNVFGKWSRPNYNSAVATFCYNIARGLDITISDPNRHVELVYIDDVVQAFTGLLTDLAFTGVRRPDVGPVTRISLGSLVAELRGMHEVRSSLRLPDMADHFRRCLFATYLSFLPPDGFAYQLVERQDNRGSLAELLKSPHFGQIFISRTRPGIERGNHYHNTKFEKFCVVEGEAIIRFRHLHSTEILSYPVKGSEFRVVDIPPGYTHSIENVGKGEMVVLFWASEPFDPATPDTYAKLVRAPEKTMGPE